MSEYQKNMFKYCRYFVKDIFQYNFTGIALVKKRTICFEYSFLIRKYLTNSLRA